MQNEKLSCPNCKNSLPPNSSFCPHCGLRFQHSTLQKITRTCKKCGAYINTVRLNYCPLCLAKLEPLASQKK